MIALYNVANGHLVAAEAGAQVTEATAWVDLLNPTKAEDQAIEAALGISVPTREEMQEIEASSRIYTEAGTHYMTAVVLHQADGSDLPITTPVTFILAGNRLVTVRYAEPRAFTLFAQRMQKPDATCTHGTTAMVGLLETIIDREADRVERIAGEVDRLAQGIFGQPKGGSQTRSRRQDIALRTIGREGDLISRSRDSLLSIDRVLTFTDHVTSERGDDKAVRARIKTATRDISSLMLHTDSLSSKVQFLLDAMLGMISIEQNNIIKIFSVASVALMPPTLIASIYGMNFKNLPEIEWTYGYPMAIGMMIVSAILPFWYFKRKGWY